MTKQGGAYIFMQQIFHGIICMYRIFHPCCFRFKEMLYCVHPRPNIDVFVYFTLYFEKTVKNTIFIT